MRQGTGALDAVGELGCSDVPGWSGSSAKSGSATSGGVQSGSSRPSWVAKSDKRSNNEAGISGDSGRWRKNSASTPAVNDGTDDYLNHLLRRPSVSKANDADSADSSGKHADIQSIQEGAEIAGNIVLLSRGGCGFLEKVKWAQRRGAIALIVGDDTKGGPLIQMYAQGDTSNVSIPSVFTSRTTAHLLSSLVGAGNFIEDTVDERGNPVLRVLPTDKPKKSGSKHAPHIPLAPTTTTTKEAVTARTTSRASKKGSKSTEGKGITTTARQPGWFKSLFFGSSKDISKSDRSQRPSNGQLDWVLVEDWKVDDHTKSKIPLSKPNKNTNANVKSPQTDDGFVIGVQDWRDPDLVGPPAEDTKDGEKVVPATKNSPRPIKSGGNGIGDAKSEVEWQKSDAKVQKDSASREESKGLLNTIFGDDDEDSGTTATGPSRTVYEGHGGDDEEYDGLWVTLTPTSGASPFLDTILVLVVSPLITLTVVYALLLVRSRIRRRRWRAPKSVVERLPVRTYQTIITSGNQSPRLPSPSSSSAATPLLQQSPIVRPQSATTTGTPEPEGAGGATSGPLQVPSPAGGSQEHEKTSGISPEWRKYMGRQVECVVCLEEYVDGVSRVMSLPCGHEFHADCM